MQMPRPTEAHHKLDVLLGSWSGTERMFPSPWDPQGGTAVGRITNRAALDGFAVVQEYAQERGGTANFFGHGVFTWDAPTQKYVLYWFDSMGMAPNQFVGTFEGQVLTLISQSPQGSTRATFDFTRDGHYTFRMDVSGDGQQWQPMMEGTYERGS